MLGYSYGLARCESADGHITLGARSLLFVFLDYLTFFASRCILSRPTSHIFAFSAGFVLGYCIVSSSPSVIRAGSSFTQLPLLRCNRFWHTVGL